MHSNMIQLLQTISVATQTSGMFNPLIMVGLMVLVFWLFMWRPETKRQKQMQKFRDGLQPGDKVITAGGIHAVVQEVEETTLRIEIDRNVVLRIDKNMVVADNQAVEK